MVPTISLSGYSTYQDAMKVAASTEGPAIVACLYDGRNNEPRAFLVLSTPLLEEWKKVLESP